VAVYGWAGGGGKFKRRRESGREDLNCPSQEGWIYLIFKARMELGGADDRGAEGGSRGVHNKSMAGKAKPRVATKRAKR